MWFDELLSIQNASAATSWWDPFFRTKSTTTTI
jgi:hypothetical protein